MNHNKANGFDYVLDRENRTFAEDGNWSWVFASLKSVGVDTKGMKLNDALKKWNELNKGKSNYRATRDNVYKKLKSKGTDGTFDEKGNPVSYDSGFQVAFQTSDSEDKGKDSYLGGQLYDKMVEAVSKRTGSKPHIGVFDEPEVSFHCKDVKEALKIAKEHNQFSIWDWEAGKQIRNPWYDSSTNHVKGE